MQVIAALGNSSPASDPTTPRLPPNFLPIKIVNPNKLIPGARIDKLQKCVNSSIVIQLYFSINVRCIKNVVEAPPPKDCRPMLAQMRNSFHIPGLGFCEFIQSAPNNE